MMLSKGSFMYNQDVDQNEWLAWVCLEESAPGDLSTLAEFRFLYCSTAALPISLPGVEDPY
jgi:hypothetical protein